MSKTILITGGTRGLGRAISVYFHKKGWNVIVNYHKSHDLAKELENEIDAVLLFQCDVRDRKSLHKMFTQIKNKFGKLDVVVNNAAINTNKLILNTSIKDWEDIIGVNLTGVFNVCQEAVKLMRHGGGHIINISSLTGKIGRKGQGAYSASKAGLLGFSKSLAKEVGIWNIKVNTVFPGYMETDMLRADLIERAKSENVLNRTNDPSDVAEFIFGLVGMDFISGQEFNLDSRIV